MVNEREETIGQRIARLRQAHGWTQEALAVRIAISRVAISHIEMDLSTPGERTIVLLSGVFKLRPPDLVAHTTYPQAKAERLPPFVCTYTELELKLALLENDLAWLAEVSRQQSWSQLAAQVREKWLAELAEWQEQLLDEQERALVAEARHALRILSSKERC